MEAQRLNLRVKFIYMEILGNKIFYDRTCNYQDGKCQRINCEG